MSGSRVDVVIVTALEEELDAVLGLELGDGGAWKDARDRRGLPYHVRELSNAHGEPLHIVAAWAGEMGAEAAVLRAQTLVHELHPAMLAMCGLCAGRREHVFLGDVIVAESIFEYDRGKVIAPHDERDAQFLPDPVPYRLDHVWRTQARYLAKKFTGQSLARPRPPSSAVQMRWLLHGLHAHEQGGAPSPLEHPERQARCPDWTRLLRDLRKQGFISDTPGTLALTEQGLRRVKEERLSDPDGKLASDPPFRVHVAPLATGKTVREDSQLFERLRLHFRTVLGVEMEAAAIARVADQSSLKALVVKAVCDYADHEKDDAFHGFACHASAAFLFAFIREHVRPAKATPASRPRDEPRADPGTEGEEDRQKAFLESIEKACAVQQPEGVRLTRRKAPAPFGLCLEVSFSQHGFPWRFPVAALDQPATEEMLQAFLDRIHSEYRRQNPAVTSTLIYSGGPASAELVQKALKEQVYLTRFAEYQGIFDFARYVQWQTTRLENNRVYPPALYVEQRARVSIGGQETALTEDVLQTLRAFLDSPHPRFALVLGNFGTGKTFLLHELARRMATEGTPLVPVLIELRALQKHHSLKALIAQHFAAADLGKLTQDQFLYMLQEGRLALLFDGFDELALRVTYEQAMTYFGTLLEAAQGRAKVVITSRTQHFLTDHEVKRELIERAEALPGYRLIRLEPFNEAQIRSFLTRRLQSPAAADERLALLRDVRDLRGLSENPRMLGFIADLTPEELEEARRGDEKITAARLYEVLIDRWLKGEHERVNPAGAPKGLSLEQLWSATTQLALQLWERPEQTVKIQELSSELLRAVNAPGGNELDAEVIRHQLGSGSLLVRDEAGLFSFVHQSILEWLVARKAAEDIRAGRGAPALERRVISDLMADFFIDLAGPKVARNWAEAEAARSLSATVQRNALRNSLGILRRLREARKGTSASAPATPFLQGSDLRGQDLSDANLPGANLEHAILSGVTLVRANLESATLREAQLTRANLERANLKGADLSGADLSGARLLGADLRGAKLDGAKLRGTRMVGAQFDGRLLARDRFGAALPDSGAPIPTTMTTSACYAVAFSPKDALVATAHSDGTVRLWDTLALTPLRVLQGHEGAVLALAFSSDGAFLASGSADGQVFVWNVSKGERWGDLGVHAANVRAVAFTPDGTRLASGADDGTITVWNVAEGSSEYQMAADTAVSSLAFSLDGQLLAAGAQDASILVWHLPQEQLVHTLLAHSAGVQSVLFCGSLLASGALDESVRLWDLQSGLVVASLPGHSEGATSLAVGADGRTLAAGCGDGSAILWDTVQRQVLALIKGNGNNEAYVALSPDGSTLALGYTNGPVALRNVGSGNQSRLHRGYALHVQRVALSPDGETLAAGCSDGSIALWNVLEGRQLQVLRGLSASIKSITFDVTGTRLAVGSIHGGILIFDLPRKNSIGAFQAARGLVSLAFTGNGAFLAVGAADGSITIWNVEAQERLAVLDKGHSANVHDVAFSPDGATLASASADRTVILWNVLNERRLQVLRGHENDVLSVAFSPDGTRLASGSSDRTVELWSVADGQRLRSIPSLLKGALDVAFSPDGRTLAYADRTVMLCDLEGTRPPRALGLPTERVLSLAFSPEGDTLVSNTTDNTMQVWDVVTGECLSTFIHRPDGWVAFRPDGRFKMKGDLGGAFWHAINLCRFEPGELDPYLPRPLRIPDDEPLLSRE